MNLPLEGRRALVGGSSRGIGLGCAVSLAAAGADVTVLARHADSLAAARLSLPTPGAQHHGAIAVDFGDWQAVRDLVAVDLEANGPAAVLVNNTGGPPAGPLAGAEEAAFADWFSTHMLTNQALVGLVREGMVEEGYGRIINILSTSVVTPIANLGVSNTIRGAVAQWARTLAAELAPFGITVNNILPGSIDTVRLRTSMQAKAEKADTTEGEIEQQTIAAIPAGRLGTPSDIGSVVAFLASPGAEYVTGVNLPVDGGRLIIQ